MVSARAYNFPLLCLRSFSRTMEPCSVSAQKSPEHEEFDSLRDNQQLKRVNIS